MTEQGAGPLEETLRNIPVRVWVELGRAAMPAGRLAGLPPGEVVELDRDVDDPVELYVDGMRFATGRLVVSDDDGAPLALQIESIVAPAGRLPERTP
jgi:flagellar motor switch protein FliN/FliY